MAKKKIYKKKSPSHIINDPLVACGGKRIRVFNSFEEQATYELTQLAKLSSEQILQQLRKFINIAYGMHGYDPDNLPKKHSIKIISK